MKMIILGDTHGRPYWQKIVEKENNVDRWVFVGDYFDSRDITTHEQIENFKNILEFKKNNMDKVILLLANHDYHYLKSAQEKYSGFQKFKFIDINEVLEPAVQSGLITACYTYENYVFTHAGVTKTWCEDNDIDINHLADSINKALLERPEIFRFAIGDNLDNSGDDITQSPIWVRIPSLLKDKLDNKVFVVGHTTLKELTITDSLIGIDTIGTSGEYLEILDGTPTAKKI